MNLPEINNRLGSCVLLIVLLLWLSPAAMAQAGGDPISLECPPDITIGTEDAPECIEFEGLGLGQIPDQVETRWGAVGVLANSRRYPDQNAAMIFNTAVPTGNDDDLGAPNEDFGGPGVGRGGQDGSPFRLDREQGNVLIISRNLDSSDPNDYERGGTITLDFSTVGPVTLHSLELVDVERPGEIRLYGQNGQLLNTIPLQLVGDNGFLTVDLGGTTGVVLMEIDLGDSGSLDKVCFSKGIPLGFPQPETTCDGPLGVSFTDEIIAGDCPGNYTILRTYRVLDDCGNEATCTQTIEVVHDLPPQIVNCSPEPVDLGCNPASIPGPRSLEIEGGTGQIRTRVIADTLRESCQTTIRRTYIATDECGLADTCVETLFFQIDTEAPQFGNPSDTVLCVEVLPAFDPASIIVQNEACGQLSYALRDSSGQLENCDQAVFRTITVTDACGNSSSLRRIFNLCEACSQIPIEAPSLCPEDIDLGCNPTEIPPPVTTIGNDTVRYPATLLRQDFVEDGCLKSLVRTYTYDPGDGLDTCVQRISFTIDNEAPVINTPPDDTLVCPGDILLFSPDLSLLSATDDCGAPEVSYADQRDTLADGSVQVTRTYTATDACGNAATTAHVISLILDPALCDGSQDDCPDIAFLDLSPIDQLPASVSCPEMLPPQPDLFFENRFGQVIAAQKELNYTPDSCGGFAIYTWTATDNTCNSNSLTETAFVLVEPVLPQLEIPADDTVSCEALKPSVISYDNGETGACAISGNATGTLSLIAGTPECPEAYLERWEVPLCFDTLRGSRTITVVRSPLQLVCGDTLELFFPDEIPAPDPGSIATTGGCGPLRAELLEARTDTLLSDFGGLDRIVATYTFAAADGCGTADTCQQVFVWYPPAPAPWTCEISDLDLGCDPAAIPGPLTPDSSAANNYTLFYTLIREDTLSQNCFWELRRTYRVTSLTDAVLGQCEQLIFWQNSEDGDPLQILCPPNFTISSLAELPAPDSILPIAGGCPLATTFEVVTDTLIAPGGAITVERTYTATDLCGNSASCTQTIEVEDLDANALGFPFETDTLPACNPTVIPRPVTNADIPDTLPFILIITDFQEDTLEQGCRTTLSRAYTISASLREFPEITFDTTLTFELSWLVDNADPVIESCPQDAFFTGDIPPPAFDQLVASDDCGIESITYVDQIDTAACGTITVERTFMVTDSCGNMTSCLQTLECTDCLFPCPLPADTLLACPGDTVYLNPSAAGSGCQYIWAPGDQVSDPTSANPFLIAPPTGQEVLLTVSITSADGNCSRQKRVLVRSERVVPTDFTVEYDCGSTAVTFRPEAGTFERVRWDFGVPGIETDTSTEVNPTYLYPAPGDYTVTLSAIRGESCLAASVQGITVPAPLEVKVPADTTSCGEPVRLTGSSPQSEVEFQWTDPNGLVLADGPEINVLPDQVGIYILVSTDAQDCSRYDTVTVTNQAVRALPLPGQNIQPCRGDTFRLQIRPEDPLDTFSLQWIANPRIIGFDDDDLPLVSGTDQPARIQGVATNTAGCTDTVEFSIQPAIQFDLELRDTLVVCQGEPLQIGPQNAPEGIYRWSPGDLVSDSTLANPEFTGTNSAQLTLRVLRPGSGGFLCDTFLNQYVNLQPAVGLQLEAREPICAPGPVTLRASSTETAFFIWSDQADFSNILATTDTFLVNVTEEATYYLRAESDFCSESLSVPVEVTPLEAAITDPRYCEVPEAAEVVVTNLNPAQTLSYDWLDDGILEGPDGNADARFLIDSSRTVSVALANEAGCRDTLTANISIIDLAGRITATADPDTIFAGQQSQLAVSGCDECGISWAPEESLQAPRSRDPIASPDISTDYILTATLEECVHNDTVPVFVIELCDDAMVFIPNTFTPDNNNMNDVFRVRTKMIEEGLIETFDFFVYNRWGEQLFRTQDPEEGWDGTFNGEKLEPGVFGYYLEIQCRGGSLLRLQGNVTLIR